jgi:hypothetical protein
MFKVLGTGYFGLLVLRSRGLRNYSLQRHLLLVRQSLLVGRCKSGRLSYLHFCLYQLLLPTLSLLLAANLFLRAGSHIKKVAILIMTKSIICKLAFKYFIIYYALHSMIISNAIN